MMYPSDAMMRLREPTANGAAAPAGARPTREATTTPERTVTLTVAQARRLRAAYAKADAVLRRLDHVRSHPLSGAAREARSEIGAAVAHLDLAAPPVDADVVTGLRISVPHMEDSHG